jgi:hypothetical protein
MEKTKTFLEGLKPEGVFEVEQDETTKVYD